MCFAGAGSSLPDMRGLVAAVLFVWLAAIPLPAASKPHVVVFGKWQTVKWFAERGKVDAPGVDRGVNLKIWPSMWTPSSRRTGSGPPTR